MTLTIFDPTQVYLEISPEVSERAWQKSQVCSTKASRWHSYLNHLSLEVCLSWLQEEYSSAKVWPNLTILDCLSELVNGVVLTSQGKRFVIIPSETIDLSELRVPQEWVDIPSWVADYYLAVQVNLDDAYVRIWGFCTHTQLKNSATYEANSRTYCLDEEELISDLSILSISESLHLFPSTRVAVAPLANLSLAQAENLLQRLANPNLLIIRTEIPFTLWGALLDHTGWLQKLVQLRRGLPEQQSILAWLESGISQFAQQLGWQMEFKPNLVGARSAVMEKELAAVARTLNIEGQLYELTVFNYQPSSWRFELRNLNPGGMIPAGFKLKLLTEDLQDFEGNEDLANSAVEQLFVEVELAPQEAIVWAIEPNPEDYIREIIRF